MYMEDDDAKSDGETSDNSPYGPDAAVECCTALNRSLPWGHHAHDAELGRCETGVANLL